MVEKSYENILVYDILYKTLIGAKPLHIMFDKVDGFIRVYDGPRYLVSYFSIKYQMMPFTIGLKKKSKKWYYVCFSHNYAKVKIDL